MIEAIYAVGAVVTFVVALVVLIVDDLKFQKMLVIEPDKTETAMTYFGIGMLSLALSLIWPLILVAGVFTWGAIQIIKLVMRP